MKQLSRFQRDISSASKQSGEDISDRNTEAWRRRILPVVKNSEDDQTLEAEATFGCFKSLRSCSRCLGSDYFLDSKATGEYQLLVHLNTEGEPRLRPEQKWHVPGCWSCDQQLFLHYGDLSLTVLISWVSQKLQPAGGPAAVLVSLSLHWPPSDVLCSL